MIEQSPPPDDIEEIPFTKHPELHLEDISIDLETGRETVHETTNFKILFRAYLALKSVLQGSETVDEAVLEALKTKANPLERVYLDTVAQNWPTLNTGFSSFAEAYPGLYKKMADYIQRQNGIVKARNSIEAQHGRGSPEASLLYEQSLSSPQELAQTHKIFSMGLDGVIQQIKQHDPGFDINVLNQ